MRLTIDRVTNCINWIDLHIEQSMAILSFIVALLFFQNTPPLSIPQTTIAAALTTDVVFNSLITLFFSLITVALSTTLVHFLKKYLNNRYGNSEN